MICKRDREVCVRDVIYERSLICISVICHQSLFFVGCVFLMLHVKEVLNVVVATKGKVA